MNPFFILARLKNRLGRRKRPGGGKLACRNRLRARALGRPRDATDARETARARAFGEGKSGGGARAPETTTTTRERARTHRDGNETTREDACDARAGARDATARAGE